MWVTGIGIITCDLHVTSHVIRALYPWSSGKGTLHRYPSFRVPTPQVCLATELGPWVWRLQEQSLGMLAWAPSKKGAQPHYWHRPHQLVDGKLASTNKAEAACQVKSPMLAKSLPRLPFLIKSLFCWDLLRKYRDKQEMGPQETTRKTKFCCTNVYVRCQKYVLNGGCWETSLKGRFCQLPELRLGKKSS